MRTNLSVAVVSFCFALGCGDEQEESPLSQTDADTTGESIPCFADNVCQPACSNDPDCHSRLTDGGQDVTTASGGGDSGESGSGGSTVPVRKNRPCTEESRCSKGVYDSLRTFYYDDNGMLESADQDLQNDGSIDIYHTYTLTDDGLIRQDAWDTDMDGVADEFNEYTYDSEGKRLLMENTDTNGNRLFRVEYSYEENGRIMIAEVHCFQSATNDCYQKSYPDRIHSTIRYTLDEDGEVIRKEIDTGINDNTRIETGPDGIIDVVCEVTRTYDCWE